MNLSEGNQNLNILSDSINYSRNMSGNSSILQNYSEQVQRRISALKKNQLEIIDLEYKFYSRIHEIEAEFQPLFNAVYEKVFFFFLKHLNIIFFVNKYFSVNKLLLVNMSL